MKKTVLILFVFLFISRMGMAQTDEQLREEIRKEILEEQRQKEAKELLEYRKEKIRREEEARIKAEKDSLNDALLEKSKAKPQSKESKKDNQSSGTRTWEEKNERRIDGWSISLHVGPNFPLGDYAKDSGNKAWYATTGYTFSIRNYIHFNKLIGIFIGVGYDGNDIDKYAYEQTVRAAIPSAVDVEVISATPYHNYTIKAGPSIRKLGHGIGLYFQPFIGLNILNSSDYQVVYRDGSVYGGAEVDGKSSTMFLVGASLELCSQIGRTSDIVFGLETNMAFGSVAQDIVQYRDFDSQFSSAFFEISPIRLALVIGYRFHL